MNKNIEVMRILGLGELYFESIADLKIVTHAIEELKDNITPSLGKLGVDIFDYAQKLMSKGNVIVVKLDKDIVGMSGFYANNHIDYSAYLSFLALNKKVRGLCVGRRLIDMTELMSLERGMKEMRLEVYYQNHNAIDFYKKGGYMFVEKKKNGFVEMKKYL